MRVEPVSSHLEPLETKHHAGILTVVEHLPEWFDETARTRSVPTDLQHQSGFVAVSDERVVGFVTLYVTEGRMHIGWLAVDRPFHRQGIGSMLLNAAEAMARELQIDELATYTLGEGVEYQPYESTRRFYWKHGFKVYKRSRTDNPGCPEEIWISKQIIP
ncbi:MAG: GNAT family N-acetyltransferase [Gemmatimonadota bacterium]|nr:GNAT family N-acetyltransferase [Gemmatimonadota bacterium]